jgi:hypothetical protein
VAVFYFDPTYKFPQQGIVVTVNSINVAAVEFLIAENIALVAQFMGNNKPVANIDVTVSVKAEKRVLRTDGEGKITVNSLTIPVSANDVVVFETSPPSFKPFLQNVTFPVMSANVVLVLEAGNDLSITLQVQTGDKCTESNVILNAKNHIYKGTTK